MADPSLDVTAVIAAPAARVLHAFFDAEALNAWWQVAHSVTTPRVLGPYAIELHALDASGTRVDATPGTTTGWLLAGGDMVVLPPQVVAITQPMMELHFNWHPPANCAPLRVRVIVWATFGDSHADMTWSCNDPDPTVSMPAANLREAADVISGDTVVSQSDVADIARVRGKVNVDLHLAWP